jgi:hypothetical protein
MAQERHPKHAFVVRFRLIVFVHRLWGRRRRRRRGRDACFGNGRFCRFYVRRRPGRVRIVGVRIIVGPILSRIRSIARLDVRVGRPRLRLSGLVVPAGGHRWAVFLLIIVF